MQTGLVLLVLFSLPCLTSSQCTLFGGEQSAKPYPSLWKCYRYNKLACCASTHDSQINNEFLDLMSSSCQRLFPDLERYFCFGCSPLQGPFVDMLNKTITLCRSFAEMVWGGILDLPNNNYDNCALNTYWRTNSTTVLQSQEWPNGYAFFNDIKPPYFHDYKIIVSDNTSCFNWGQWVGPVLGVLILALH